MMKMTSTSTTDMQIIKLPEISTPGLLKLMRDVAAELEMRLSCLLYTSPSPRD